VTESEHLRKLGHEYGATTGRPRRCGWFDVPLIRSSVRHNRFTALVITKLDVLDSFETIKVCTSYRSGGRTISEFDTVHAAESEPQYATLPGWRESIAACMKWRDLPVNARKYLLKLEELVGCPVAMVSTGKDRCQTIETSPARLKWFR
jgi:adenylosuccinate synthase